MAAIVSKLMVGLGFDGGYIAQGGDIGSFVARILAAQYDACKAVHSKIKPKHSDQNNLTDHDLQSTLPSCRPLKA